MSRKTLASIAAIALIFSDSGCSVFEKLVYHPDINQGNYLDEADIKKIKNGMTKQQVVHILGTSMIKEPFGSNIWFYIFRREYTHQCIAQKTLALTFDSNNILIHIDNKKTLERSRIK